MVLCLYILFISFLGTLSLMLKYEALLFVEC